MPAHELKRDRQTIWDGVRNYQARNFLRSMQPGDLAFFYHSNAMPLGVAGMMKIVESGIADPTQFDSTSRYYDVKSTKELPRWQTVCVEFVEEFSHLVSLDTLRSQFSPDQLLVVKLGNRLSVMPITSAIAQRILTLSNIAL